MYYNFYIKHVLQNGNLIYGETFITHLNKIAVLQRKLLRLIPFKRRTINAESEMIQAKIVSVPQPYT